MNEPSDIHQRVTRLEYQMADVRQDAAAARVLAGAADRDVADMHAELRGHTKTLNALRETQLEQGERLDRHDERFDRLDTKVDRLENTMVDGFSMVDARIAQIAALLTPKPNEFDES